MSTSQLTVIGGVSDVVRRVLRWNQNTFRSVRLLLVHEEYEEKIDLNIFIKSKIFH